MQTKETKPKVILANAFSLSMLSKLPATLKVEEISVSEVKELLSQGFESAIGHESTAKLLSQLLGVEVHAKRIMVTLESSTILIVFQLLERLPEGKVLSLEEIKQLVEKGKAKFIKVQLIE